MRRGLEQGSPGLGPGTVALTHRGRRRRALILEAAATLFAERGYDGVSINDIGVRAGITGPAIYRYFPSKDSLLVSIVEHLQRRTHEGLDQVLSSGLTGRSALGRLIDLQLELAFDEPEKIRIVADEERHLSERESAELRGETRHLLCVWTDVLREARPDLGPDECDAAVHAVLALINSTALKRSPEDTSREAREQLRAMALAAVSAPCEPAGCAR